MSDGDCFRRLYREDEKADENWNNAVTRKALERPVVSEGTPNTRTQLEHEYVLAVVRPGTHYSVDVPAARVQGEDEPQEPQAPAEARHFQVLKVASARAREHIMPTVFSADELSLTAHVAFLVQYAEERAVSVDLVPAGETPPQQVYMSSDPVWVRPEEIAPFASWSAKLWRYESVTPSTEEACLVLAGKQRAVPMYTLLDPRCPTLSITFHLRRIGWCPVSRRIEHTTLAIGDMDDAEAAKRKCYYQALVVLKACLPLTSVMPSREPQAYYKLLLRGVRAEPNQRAKDLQAILNGELAKKQKAPEPIPIEDLPPEAADSDEDAIKPAGPAKDPKPPKPKSHSGPGIVRVGKFSRARLPGSSASGKPAWRVWRAFRRRRPWGLGGAAAH